MNDEQLKLQIGKNIAAYRKHRQLTQAKLAELLNYSDKAVSKWERGESMPDVTTLVQLAELFEVTVNDLLVDPEAVPEHDAGMVERAVGRAIEKTLKRKAQKRIILQLSALLVWLLATLCFVILSAFDIRSSWMTFVYAIPADAVVRLSLRSAWRDFRRNQGLISVILWGGLLSVYLSFLVFAGIEMWRLALLGVPGQAAIFLWFRLYHKPTREGKHG